MVVIRPIIAVGWALLSVGCGSQYLFPGEWTAQRDLQLAPDTQPSAAATLGKVELDIREDGRFDLFDMSIPMEGRLDLNSKTQSLQIDRVAGMPTDRAGTGSKPSYTIKVLDDGSIELKSNTRPTVVLHAKAKPPKG